MCALEHDGDCCGGGCAFLDFFFLAVSNIKLSLICSLTFINWTVKPIVSSLLSTALPASTGTAALRILDGLFATFWILPTYFISYLVSCIWYGEIAERTAFAAQREAQQRFVDTTKVIAPAPSRLLQVRHTDAITSISRQAYGAFFLSIHFCISMIVTMLPLPYFGPCLSFLMLSSLYALYCFDYKWNLHGVPLEHRTQFVEEHWVYFTGFGALMVLIATNLPYFSGSAVGLLIYPLCIVAAADAHPREAYLKTRGWFQQRRQDVQFPRLPLFKATAQVANFCLYIVQLWVGSKTKKNAARPSTASSIRGKGDARIKKQN